MTSRESFNKKKSPQMFTEVNVRTPKSTNIPSFKFNLDLDL